VLCFSLVTTTFFKVSYMEYMPKQSRRYVDYILSICIPLKLPTPVSTSERGVQKVSFPVIPVVPILPVNVAHMDLTLLTDAKQVGPPRQPSHDRPIYFVFLTAASSFSFPTPKHLAVSPCDA
jgi:hypothetical protein